MYNHSPNFNNLVKKFKEKSSRKSNRQFSHELKRLHHFYQGGSLINYRIN